MGRTRVNLKEAIRWQLKDTTQDDETWDDQEVDAAFDRALRDINRREPLLTHSLLAVQDLTKSIDISDCTGLLKVISVEWPFGEVPPALRNFRKISNTIIMELSSVVDYDSGHLTGTVTFTIDSFTVTGSGTAFTSELAAGYYIKKSSGTHWYRIANVASDTSLTLDNMFEETTGADTVNVTDYANSQGCAMVDWTSEYTVDEDAESDLPQKMEDIVILGTVARLISSQATKYANEMPIGPGAVNNYQAQADRFMAEYQASIAGIGRPEDSIVSSYPIT